MKYKYALRGVKSHINSTSLKPDEEAKLYLKANYFPFRNKEYSGTKPFKLIYIVIINVAKLVWRSISAKARVKSSKARLSMNQI